MKVLLAATFSLGVAACASSPIQRAEQPEVLDHGVMYVANGSATAKFYEDIFGFREMKNPFLGGEGVIWLNVGNGIAMHIFGGRKTPVADERERHFAFGVTDISRVTGYLKSHGLNWQDFDGVVDRVQTRLGGVQQLFFRDPNGYWIEVNGARGVLKR